jgi:hypothetical protein
MNEQMPKKENGITPTNEQLGYIKLRLLRKQLEEAENKRIEITKNEDLLYKNYREKEEELNKKFPNLRKKVEEACNEENIAWGGYHECLNNLEHFNSFSETTPEAQDLWQIFVEKRRISNTLRAELKNLEEINYPDELIEIENIMNSWNSEHARINEKLLPEINENINNLWNAVIASKQEYYDLEGVNYENGVNAFLENVRAHQEKRQQQLNECLVNGLKALGKLNPINLEKGKKIFQKELFIMEGLALKWRQYTIRTVIWAFSIFALSYGAKEVGETKTESFLNTKIDSIYNAVSNTPHDSITDVIFHGIANDKELPEKWKIFIAKEDSSEISKAGKFETELYGEDGLLTPEKTEQEKKLDYISLWQINEKHGNPKVQYGGQNDKIFKDRASYYNFLNIANLPTHFGKFAFNDYIAELSHAEQFAKNQEKYATWFEKDVNRTDSIANAKNISYEEAQMQSYDNKETVEYEAHRVIEPKLEAEFEKNKENIKKAILTPKQKK